MLKFREVSYETFILYKKQYKKSNTIKLSDEWEFIGTKHFISSCGGAIRNYNGTFDIIAINKERKKWAKVKQK